MPIAILIMVLVDYSIEDTYTQVRHGISDRQMLLALGCVHHPGFCCSTEYPLRNGTLSLPCRS